MIIWVILSWIASVVVFLINPASRIPIHWNIKGQADAFLPGWGIFAYSGMITFLYILFSVVPFIDPAISGKSPEELGKTKKRIFTISSILLTILLFFQIIASINALKPNSSIGKVAIPLALALFLVFIGNILPTLSRNYFIGIRTPWTLSSDLVWDKTHRIGGYAFVLTGIISLVLTILVEPGTAMLMEVVLIVALSLLLTVFSYIFWKRTPKEGAPADE